MEVELHDANEILEPSTRTFAGYPFLQTHAMMTREIYSCYGNYNDPYGLREAINLSHATAGLVAMKMLMMYADGNEHHWREISSKLFPDKGYGHDIDCWRSLIDRSLISFSSKHAHGMKFYKITSFGREVLDIIKANDPYFRVVRWFKIDEDEVIPAMMQADLQGEEAYRDAEPEAFINLLECLFNPGSGMRRLGSAYRWMNTVVRLIKTNCMFFEKFTMPEVTGWLDSHKHYYGIEKFYKILDKVAERS